MPTTERKKIIRLAEFSAVDLGIPFEVTLLDSVKQVINPKTGEVEKTIIPNVPGLLKCVAMSRILLARKLSGSELKFIRKAFKMPAKTLADKIGVTPEHLSRCESGERVLSAGAEKCLRISVFVSNSKLPENIEEFTAGDDELARHLEIYRGAFSRISKILDEMKIDSAHLAGDELSLAFRAHSEEDKDLFADDKNADWFQGEILKAA